MIAQVASMVPSLVGPSDVYWLIGGGIVGALARALWTHDQKNFGWETGQDVVVGAIMGALWNVAFTIPVLGIDWPLVPLPLHASELQRAILMSVIAMISVSLIKRALMTWAPAYMATLMGHLPGGLSNGPVGSVSPPPGGPKS